VDLHDKVALVTGASGDIGGAIARALAAEGCAIGATYVGFAEGAQAVVEVARTGGVDADSVQLDQRDEASIDGCAQWVIERFGRCDILVNNAAWNIGIPFPSLDLLDAATWDRVLETNLRGPFLLSRALAPHLKANGAGRIVNIASVGGLNPGSSSIAYSCSKAGLIHLTHCLAVAMAPEVSVNCVAPGLVEGTRMAGRLPPAVAEGARRQAVLGKVGSADDIAAATVMLCRAETVTGQTLVVDGGMPGAMNFG
jgi:3-oxoacyl-[acyl-carrier protein] reductase